MEKKEIIEFFDTLAPRWDADQVPKDRIINIILDLAQAREGADVLDVACGTGVLFPFYEERKAGSVTGVDISSEMARRAAEKVQGNGRFRILCGDAEAMSFDRDFDLVMIYNAFPHFPRPADTVAAMARCLKPGGRLCVAHSMSRAAVDAHHHGSAEKVSMGLMSIEELRELFIPYFDIEVSISNDEMYQLVGVKR